MRYGVTTLAYLSITIGIFHNLLPVMSTSIYSDIGDPLLNTSILFWNATHVPLSSAWWNYPSFAPLSGITTWTEHLLGAYPLTTPIVWATGNPVLAYNVLLLICFPLNGLAMFALARELTGSDAGAFAAGLAFAFAPYQSGQVAHVQMLMAFGMPLALLGLHQYVERGRRQGVAWFTIGWLSVALSNAYMLVFFPILLALWCVWFARGADLSGPRVRRLVPIAIAAALVMIGVAPLLWGYHVRQAAYGLARPYDEIRSFGADLRGLVAIPHQEVLWSRWLNTTFIEASLFPGVAILALTAIGVAPRLRAAWTRRDLVVFYAAGAVAMWMLALGPEPAWNGMRVLLYGPYRLLLMLPGATSIRVPARAWLPAVLCLAVTAGAGVATLMRHARWRWAAVALAAMIVAEGWFSDATPQVPQPVWAGAIPAGAMVLDLPIGATAENVPAEYLAVIGGYRTINGYSGYAPSHLSALREALASHQPTAFDSFRRLDDLYVIVRPAVDAPFTRWMESQPGTERVSATPAWTLYRMGRIGEGAPTTLPVPLPAPGRLAFRLR
jgi:hypothetical protein